ncbi:hypothetical protein ABKN59_008762 [Abortiporus biennis]
MFKNIRPLSALCTFTGLYLISPRNSGAFSDRPTVLPWHHKSFISTLESKLLLKGPGHLATLILSLSISRFNQLGDWSDSVRNRRVVRMSQTLRNGSTKTQLSNDRGTSTITDESPCFEYTQAPSYSFQNSKSLLRQSD